MGSWELLAVISDLWSCNCSTWKHHDKKLALSVPPTVETSSLTEQIRHGKLRPMLDLGVTPSQVSVHGNGAGVDEADGEAEPEEESKEPRSYCIPLQSLGLGGNKITSLGAGYLADGLKTNTSE